MNDTIAALRSSLLQTLALPDLSRKLIRLRYPRKSPAVLSEEVARLLIGATQPKIVPPGRCLRRVPPLALFYPSVRIAWQQPLRDLVNFQQLLPLAGGSNIQTMSNRSLGHSAGIVAFGSLPATRLRLCTGRPHRLAGIGDHDAQQGGLPGAIFRGRLRWPAWLLEPLPSEWLPGDLHPLRQRQTGWRSGGRSDWLPECGWEGPWPTGRGGIGQSRWTDWWPMMLETPSGGPTPARPDTATPLSVKPGSAAMAARPPAWIRWPFAVAHHPPRRARCRRTLRSSGVSVSSPRLPKTYIVRLEGCLVTATGCR